MSSEPRDCCPPTRRRQGRSPRAGGFPGPPDGGAVNGRFTTLGMNLIDGADFSPEELMGPLRRILDEILAPIEEAP